MGIAVRELSRPLWRDLESVLGVEAEALRVPFEQGAIRGFLAFFKTRPVACCTFGVALTGVLPLSSLSVAPVFRCKEDAPRGAERALVRAALSYMGTVSSDPREPGKIVLSPTGTGLSY
jgi:hypothetical protein